MGAGIYPLYKNKKDEMKIPSFFIRYDYSVPSMATANAQ